MGLATGDSPRNFTGNSPAGIKVELTERFGKKVSTHAQIAEFTSTKLGGPVEYLVIAETVEELIDAAQMAAKHRLPFVVIGGGSGVLASDIGYPGVVIINRTSRLMYDIQRSQVVVDTGVMTDRLLNSAAAIGLGGLEFLAAVPGTVGGAVATNAGWGGKHIKSVIKELILFVPGGDQGQVVTVGGDEITIGPYQRMFPESVIQAPVILSVRLQFSQTDQVEILRRLTTLRQTRQKQILGERLGQVFIQDVSALGLDRNANNRFKKMGVSVEPATELIIRSKDRANAQALRQVIRQLGELAQAAGTNLDERLHFLGYWPDEDGEDAASDT